MPKRLLRKRLLPILLLSLGAADVPPIATGRWDVVSTAVAMDIPGVPGFVLRMMKGRSKTEYKCVTADQAMTGVAALLAPDPKARCRVDSLHIADGRYAQVLACPQREGAPLRIERAGTYDANGFTGRLQLAGATPKGAMSITLDQKATHPAGACKR